MARRIQPCVPEIGSRIKSVIPPHSQNMAVSLIYTVLALYYSIRFLLESSRIINPIPSDFFDKPTLILFTLSYSAPPSSCCGEVIRKP
jgi:hypothetical protein